MHVTFKVAPVLKFVTNGENFNDSYWTLVDSTTGFTLWSSRVHIDAMAQDKKDKVYEAKKQWIDGMQLSAIKLVREVLPLSLADAKEFCEMNFKADLPYDRDEATISVRSRRLNLNSHIWFMLHYNKFDDVCGVEEHDMYAGGLIAQDQNKTWGETFINAVVSRASGDEYKKKVRDAAEAFMAGNENEKTI